MITLNEAADLPSIMPRTHQCLQEIDPSDSLYHSLGAVGVLSPLLFLVVHGKRYVLDGFKRIQIARHLEIQSFEYQNITPPLIDSRYIAETIMGTHGIRLQHPILKACLVADLRGHFSHQDCMDILPILGLDAHIVVMKKLMTLSQLPFALQLFCIQRNYSFKQCMQLTRFDSDMVLFWVNHAADIQLSASFLLQLSDRCTDLMTRHDWSFSHLLTVIEWVSLLKQNISPNTRAIRLRLRVETLTSPTIHQYNERLNTIVNELDPPAKIKWDSSLETKAVTVTLTVSHHDQLNDHSSWLAAPKTAHAIRSMLELL